jgi:hypothetical protein
MPRYDVIVVGAGPAGSTTAYRLARAGARVCLLDRARFPRDKPCGGGLTLRAVRELPFSVEPVVEDRVDTLELGLRYARRWSSRAEGPLVLMTQRRRLDAFLAERAAAAGAEFRDGVKVTEADPAGAVTVGGERLEAEVVVGADGASLASRSKATLAMRTSLGSASAGGQSSSSAWSRAGTPGSFRRATMSTSASAAGKAKGRGYVSGSASFAPPSRSTRRTFAICAGTGYRCVGRRGRPSKGVFCLSATPPGSSIRFPGTACTRPS